MTVHDPIHHAASDSAVTIEPGVPNALAGTGTAGEVGGTPWQVEVLGPITCRVFDAGGRTMCLAEPVVANRITVSVNAWTKLFGDNCNHRDVLRALQAQLIPMRAMPAVRRALALIDETLNPKDDLQ